MNYIWIRKQIFFLIIFLMMFILICCYEFESIDQPESVDPNSVFNVPIKINLTPVEEGGRGYFSICLPDGWTVQDNIEYTGVLNGTFRYSSAWSDSLESYDEAPEGYYWWVSVSDSVDILPEGKVELSPQIQTNDQVGIFFLTYMLTDRWDDADYWIFSGDHPISVGVPPTVETVTNTNNSGEGSLREALETAGSGSTILFDLLYPATVALDSELVINRSLTILGPQEGDLTLSGINKHRVINIVNPRSVTISNLNIKDGNANDHGGGICCSRSSLYLSNMNIYGNMATGTGGISADGSILTLNNVTLSNNISIYGDCGGISIESGSLTLVNTLLWGNSPRQICGSLTSVSITHSDIQYGLEGIQFFEVEAVNWLEGNMNLYPMFVNASSNDYRLLEDSPCIDAGIQDTFLVYNEDQDTLFIPAMDYSGSAPDIGANEFDDPTMITNILEIPTVFSLSQNYPNPFNPNTIINYELPITNDVHLSIYNQIGQKIVTLVNEKQRAGYHQVEWNAGQLSSGVYYYLMRAGEFVDVKKMVLLR
jgi:hypothetical protein